MNYRAQHVWGVALVLAWAASACVGSDRRGVPLYTGGPRGSDEVAILVGPITRVDGVDVPTRGHAFELLPGCHIVEIGGKEGALSPQYGGWIASFPHLTYAFEMQARATYKITFEVDPSVGQPDNRPGQVVAREHDAQNRVRVIPFARSAADIKLCQSGSVAAPAK